MLLAIMGIGEVILIYGNPLIRADLGTPVLSAKQNNGSSVLCLGGEERLNTCCATQRHLVFGAITSCDNGYFSFHFYLFIQFACKGTKYFAYMQFFLAFFALAQVLHHTRYQILGT
jgi:hypothetical protein